MTEDRDPKVSARYAELAKEEPSRDVDAAILAAAHRAVGERPAPLVSPGVRKRWYVPLAAAAVIMLSVVVTLHVERETPELERAVRVDPAPAPVPAPVAAPETAKVQKLEEQPMAMKQRAEEPAAKAEAKADMTERRRLQTAPAAPATGPAPKREEELAAARAAQDSARRDAAGEAKPFPGSGSGSGASAPAPAAAPPPAAPPVGALSLPPPQKPEAQPRVAERPAPTARQAVTVDATAKRSAEAVETPEKWLERIAELRARNDHEAADRELAEFRKRNPDYRIPEAMLQRVERRSP